LLFILARPAAAVSRPAATVRGAHALAAPPPRPGRNLGLGQESPRPPRTILARSLVAVGSNPTAVRGSRANKIHSAPAPPVTLVHFFSRPLSLSRSSSQLSATSSSGDRASMAPLPAPSPARALPTRVSAPPSRGLAATPFSPR